MISSELILFSFLNFFYTLLLYPQQDEELIHTHSVPKPEALTSEIPMWYSFLLLAHSPNNQLL